MRHFTTAEADGDFDAIALGNELLRVFQLHIEIPDVDAGRHADLLDFDHMLIFASLFLLFRLFEAELSIVQQFADGRYRRRRNFDQVESLFLCDLQSQMCIRDSFISASV